MRFAYVLLLAVLDQFIVTRGFTVTRAEPVAPQADVVPADDKKPANEQPDRVIFFTTERCPPCEKCKRETLPALRQQGLTVGHELTNNIQVIYAPTNPGWIAAYKIDAFPTWVRIQKNCITGRRGGYMTADQVQSWRNE